MSVKFLSAEWAEALKNALNADGEFHEAAAGQHATIQQIITAEDGDTHYWIKLDGGAIDMGLGDVEAADATITQSYDTAVKLAKNETSAVSAFMTGKIKPISTTCVTPSASIFLIVSTQRTGLAACNASASRIAAGEACSATS